MSQPGLRESDRKVLAGVVTDEAGLASHPSDETHFVPLDEKRRLRVNAIASKETHRIVSDGSINATVVKDAPGVLCGVDLFTAQNAGAWLKIYDKATTPDPSGGDIPVWDGLVPGLTGGAGFVKSNLDRQFANGIAYVLVSGAADDDETAPIAGDFKGNIQFK